MINELGVMDIGIKSVNPRYVSNKKGNLVKIWIKINRINKIYICVLFCGGSYIEGGIRDGVIKSILSSCEILLTKSYFSRLPLFAFSRS